jgi:tRNA (guanine-N7-)-methyltransferase
MKEQIQPDVKRHFYGRRKGKPLREAQQQKLKSPFIVGECEAVQSFLSNYNRHVLEIGFGNGEHLVAQAANHPQTGYIGCEAFINGVAACLQDMQRNDVHNIRIWSDDAYLLLPSLAPESFDMIYLLFSDPWPKTRHHKRRFIQPHTAQLLSTLLKKNGVLRLATDDKNLAQWMLLHLVQVDSLEWLNYPDATWDIQPTDWIPTRYQEKALEQGRLPYFIDFLRI